MYELTLLDEHGKSSTLSLSPRSEALMQWPREQIHTLIQQMQRLHPKVYFLHHHWHQAIPEGTLRKHSLRLFYEHNLRERFSPIECRRAAEEILQRLGLTAAWLHEAWRPKDAGASYYWGFLLAFLLKPQVVVIPESKKNLPLQFLAAVAALQNEGAAIVWCEHA